MHRITGQGVDVEVPDGCTIEDAMRSAGHTPDSFVFVVGGTPVPMDAAPEADVRALRVASGG